MSPRRGKARKGRWEVLGEMKKMVKKSGMGIGNGVRLGREVLLQIELVNGREAGG